MICDIIYKKSFRVSKILYVEHLIYVPEFTLSLSYFTFRSSFSSWYLLITSSNFVLIDKGIDSCSETSRKFKTALSPAMLFRNGNNSCTRNLSDVSGFYLLWHTPFYFWLNRVCAIMVLPTKITDLIVKDIRFPTSLEKDGSDAMVIYWWHLLKSNLHL